MPNPDHTPDQATAPDIDDIDVLAVIFDDEPVVILLAAQPVALITAATGELVAGDALESAVRARGARPMLDLEFDAEPEPGWHARIDTAAQTLQITTPDPLPLYTGDLHAEPAWHRLAARNVDGGRGIVVITGTAPATGESALEMISQGRASWIRIPLQIVAAQENRQP